MVINSRVALLLLPMAALLSASLLLPAAAVARRIVWRSRIILLGIVLIYTWTSPGVLLWPDLSLFSPTREGWAAGSQQVLRMLVALVSLGWALSGLQREQRFTGFVALLHPWHRLGLPVERIAVRLALTLSWLDALPARMRWSEWRDAWAQAVAADGQSDVVSIELGAFAWQDYALQVLAVAGVVLCVWR